MKTTKEELIAKIGELEAKNLLLEGNTETMRIQQETKDKDLRIEFSKALDAPINYDKEYGYSTQKTGTRVTYSWHEIFRELGKVLAARNFMDFDGTLSELEVKQQEQSNLIYELERKVFPDKPAMKQAQYI